MIQDAKKAQVPPNRHIRPITPHPIFNRVPKAFSDLKQIHSVMQTSTQRLMAAIQKELDAASAPSPTNKP